MVCQVGWCKMLHALISWLGKRLIMRGMARDGYGLLLTNVSDLLL